MWLLDFTPLLIYCSVLPLLWLFLNKIFQPFRVAFPHITRNFFCARHPTFSYRRTDNFYAETSFEERRTSRPLAPSSSIVSRSRRRFASHVHFSRPQATPSSISCFLGILVEFLHIGNLQRGECTCDVGSKRGIPKAEHKMATVKCCDKVEGFSIH